MPLRNFIRPNYFFGKQLSVEDFQREQEYHREKNRLHNRLLVGAGVVGGLRVSVEQQELVVSPGVAIDCQGNELVLAVEHRQPLTGKSGRHFIVVKYAEVPGGSAPTPSGSLEPAYIEETVVIEVSQSPPPCAGKFRLHECAEPHPIRLAAISLRGSRWRVSAFRSGRRHRE